MQDPKNVIAEILNCGQYEVNMLLKTEIDIAETVQIITENRDTLNMCNLYLTAFYEKVSDVFYNIPEYHEDDFEIYYDGALGTHIYLKDYDYYHEMYPQLIDEIETYMDMEFEEVC